MGEDVAVDLFLFALDRLYVSKHAVRLEPLSKLGCKIPVVRG
jgi:hypothetical protein